MLKVFEKQKFSEFQPRQFSFLTMNFTWGLLNFKLKELLITEIFKKLSSFNRLYMLHFAGKGSILSVLEKEILGKIGEMVKKSEKKNYFPYFGMLRPQETPLCWQNTEEVISRVYSHSILCGNKGPIWSISIAAMYSECKVTQKQVSRPQKVWHTS